ncbi:universal stress protein [Actinomadura gamaensis]|uniref:Universal stress protein n=1 Tax=Actinomadura gamaensis TaxID=1763541 RepID=A0ABV9U1V0_9ACTN
MAGSVEHGPVQHGPDEHAPVEQAPAEPGPAEPGPVRRASVEPGPVEHGPVRRASVEPGPVERGPVRRASVEPAPVEHAPVEPGSVEPVLVGTDGSPAADRAVRWAADDAARHRRPLLVAHVVEPWLHDWPSAGPPGRDDVAAERGRALLARARDLARERHPELAVDVRLVRESSAHHGIRSLADGTYEVVLGHRGLGGFAGLVLGSTSLHLAGDLRGPVVVVRGAADPGADEIVAGLGLRESPMSVLAYAFEAAAARRARLRVVHAWWPTRPDLEAGADLDGAQAAFRDHVTAALEPWRNRRPEVKVVEDVFRGHPVEALLTRSAEADLVVVGRRTRTGPHLGSVSHGLIQQARCPVAVVRPRR